MAEPTRTHATRDQTRTAAPDGIAGGESAAPGSAPPPSGHRYVLGEEIARGGMGVVHRAADTVLGREVAVKVLGEKYAPDSGTARRFADEARIAAQLQHPAIPPVHDLGTLPDGRPFLAMKLIKGDTLEELLKSRPDPAVERGRFVAVFEQVCHAVAFAHDRHVIHRDLKPANVMVGNFAEVQVMDWGLAKVLGDRPAAADDPDATAGGTEVRTLRDGGAEFTQAGSVLGTPAFMPPEQAIGAVDQIDKRSDVFGLGGILAAVLTGRAPYQGETAESTRQLAARAKVDDCFARLDRCGADPELIALAKRCLSPEKADRPADAREVAEAVAQLRAAADDRARRADLDRVRAEGEKAAAEARAAEQRKRRRAQLALAAAVGLLATGGAVFGWWADRQAGERRFADEQRAAAEAARLGRNAEAVASLLGQVEEALKANDAGRAGPLLAAAEKRAAEGGAEAHAGRLDRLRDDDGLLREFDKIDQFRWTPNAAGRFQDAAAQAARYKQALAKYGLDPDAAAATEVAARVSASSVRDRLVAALDRMLAGQRSARVREVLRAVDRDEFRDQFRDALAAGDHKRRLALAVAPQAAAQPPAFVVEIVDVLGAWDVEDSGGNVGGYPVPGTLLKKDKDGNVTIISEPKPEEYPEVQARRRRELLTAALLLRPNDFGLLMARGETGLDVGKERQRDRVQWYRAAVAVAPKNPAAHYNLGRAMLRAGNAAAGTAELQIALDLDPNYAPVHLALGDILVRQGNRTAALDHYLAGFRLDPATPFLDKVEEQVRATDGLDGLVALHRERVARLPTDARAHATLGTHLQRKALVEQGDHGPALAAYREAVRLDPKAPALRTTLVRGLLAARDLDGALAAYHEAVRGGAADLEGLGAPHAPALFLYLKGDHAAVVARCRKAVADERGDLNAGLLLAYSLEQLGDYNAAMAAYRALPVFSELPHDVWVPILTRLRVRVALLPRLPRVLAGTEKPARAAEVAAFAELCAAPPQRRYAAAARMYDRAFAADPELSTGETSPPPLECPGIDIYSGIFFDIPLPDPHVSRRYAAACAAARAGFGEGTDAPADPAERAALRAKALGWLREEFPRWRGAALAQRFDSRWVGQVQLLQWLTDPALAATWSGPRRADLPAAERQEWDAFWAEVRAAAAGAVKAPPRPTAPPPRTVKRP